MDPNTGKIKAIDQSLTKINSIGLASHAINQYIDFVKDEMKTVIKLYDDEYYSLYGHKQSSSSSNYQEIAAKQKEVGEKRSLARSELDKRIVQISIEN